MSAIFNLKDDLKRIAREVGFDLAGIAGVADRLEHRFFPDWIAEGRAGEMKYLEARNDAGELKRASLAHAAPWARSIAVCALNYNTGQPYSTHAGSPTQGWISRYAWSQHDYHAVLLEKLRALEARLVTLCAQHEIPAPRTWCYVDTGPVIERIFAKYAGIGWIGKNTCILNEQLGSWLFLGVMLTSLQLDTRPASARSLRFLHPLSGCLPHQRLPRSLSARRNQVHLISHDRVARLHSGAATSRHRTADFWLRHLPGCLPLEPARSHYRGSGVRTPSAVG